MLAPASFSRLVMLCGSVLVVLSLLSFIAGPLLVLPEHFADPISQEEPVAEHINATNRVGNSAVTRTSGSMWTSKLSKYYYGCSDPRQVSKFQSNGYLLIEASGGLNQQRTGIIDAVVVARILNATLVVPHLDHTSFWKDNSNFSDIFNVEQFITALKPYISIVKELPVGMKIQKGKIFSTRVPRKCTPDYYRKRVLPMLQKNKVIRLTKFDYRLSNRLDEDLQKLRCRVNYHALQFTRAIKTMGNVLVDRLRQRSGRYIALHLRFEPDMLAFSGCYYGGGEKEIKELGQLRKRWKAIHHRNPDRERRNGRCPLTPEEVGFMLHALGFGSDCYLYVASGEVYGGENTLAPLKEMFPNFYTKDSLATEEDLYPFSAYSSRMAAIDFIVCDESDVFVANNNGNMARMLAGRRRYFGHKRTIRSNAKQLGSLFLAKKNMTWNAFTARLRKLQKGFMGEPNEMRPGRGQFFENPAACICQTAKAKHSLKDLQETNKAYPYAHGHDEEHHVDLFSGLEGKEDAGQEQMDSYDVEEDTFDQQNKEKDDNSRLGRIEDMDPEENPWLSD